MNWREAPTSFLITPKGRLLVEEVILRAQLTGRDEGEVFAEVFAEWADVSPDAAEVDGEL